ncbi:MAG: hypothetical protein KKH52_01245 [Nanoarchaeota archaeon]|nr:hypothetical protein [Nanoarchaeota archaeon]MBU1974002.1 hypothetical protein [Nanoarchaeota archaeon]
MLLEKLFVAVLIMSILVGSSLVVVAFSESKEEPITKDNQQPYKFIVVDNKVSSEDNSDEEYNYLINQIKKLKKEIKAIPAVTAPLY